MNKKRSASSEYGLVRVKKPTTSPKFAGDFDKFPFPLLLQILSFLDIQNLLRLTSTCKKFEEICTGPEIFKVVNIEKPVNMRQFSKWIFKRALVVECLRISSSGSTKKTLLGGTFFGSLFGDTLKVFHIQSVTLKNVADIYKFLSSCKNLQTFYADDVKSTGWMYNPDFSKYSQLKHIHFDQSYWKIYRGFHIDNELPNLESFFYASEKYDVGEGYTHDFSIRKLLETSPKLTSVGVRNCSGISVKELASYAQVALLHDKTNTYEVKTLLSSVEKHKPQWKRLDLSYSGNLGDEVKISEFLSELASSCTLLNAVRLSAKKNFRVYKKNEKGKFVFSGIDNTSDWFYGRKWNVF